MFTQSARAGAGVRRCHAVTEHRRVPPPHAGTHPRTSHPLKKPAGCRRRLVQRVRLLVLKGRRRRAEDPHRHRPHRAERTSGETIRDTYGDYLVEDGELVYFEPLFLLLLTRRQRANIWRFLRSDSDADGGVLDESIPSWLARTSRKRSCSSSPDNFRFPERPPRRRHGTFSRTGLTLSASRCTT